MTESGEYKASPQLRILTVAESFFLDHRNGLARVAWDVCRSLARRGHEITLVAPAPVASRAEQVIEGVRVVRFPQPHVSGFSPWNPRHRVAAYAEALRPLAATSWDCVHCHGIYGAVAAAKAIGNRKRLVLTVHSPAVDEQRWNWTHGGLWERLKLAGLPLIQRIEAEALSAADACTSLSQFTCDRMRAIYPAAASKPWTVIPHWSDPTWRRTLPIAEARGRLGWNRDERIILSVRQLRSRYGLDVAIRAMAALPENLRCRLCIVGQGEERPKLERLAARLELGDRVTFLGSVDDAQLRLCYQAADVFVIPSRALECFGLIAVEALGFGVPIVATRVGGLPEILAPILPESIVPPGYSEALARALTATFKAAGQEPSPQAMVNYVDSAFAEDRRAGEYESVLASDSIAPVVDSNATTMVKAGDGGN